MAQIEGMESRRLPSTGTWTLRDVPHRNQRLGGQLGIPSLSRRLDPDAELVCPFLTSNKEAGLGDWTIPEISEYLRIGRFASRRGVRSHGGGRLR